MNARVGACDGTERIGFGNRDGKVSSRALMSVNENCSNENCSDPFL